MADMCPVCGETNFGLAYCPACDHPYPESDDDLDDLDDEDDEDDEEDEEDEEDDEDDLIDDLGW
ncbi:MAG: hypothetical protein ACKO2C_01625 [Actinomycetes bacterium]